MRKLPLTTFVTTVSLLGSAFAAGIGDVPWNQSNIETLRSFDKIAVVQFINHRGKSEGIPAAMKERDVREFEWVDLAGDGKFALALIGSSGPCCVDLLLYRQDASGKVTFQAFDGAGTLSNSIKDLNGDGQEELILGRLVVENPGPLEFYRPAVYRLENGKYVEASRDFPDFYDNEVLPDIEQQIGKYQAKTGPGAEDMVAGLTMERDDIQRLLGRDPTAGLTQAYQWMNSDDPILLQDAAATFQSIGGHEQDMRAAIEALTQAQARERAARQGG